MARALCTCCSRVSSGPHGAEGNLDKLRSEIEQSGGDASAVLCDVKDGNARSVVHFAAAGGHREVIEFVRSSTDDRCAPRRAAASRHRPHPLSPLSALSALDGMGNTPLSLAVSAGHLDLAQRRGTRGRDISVDEPLVWIDDEASEAESLTPGALNCSEVDHNLIVEGDLGQRIDRSECGPQLGQLLLVSRYVDSERTADGLVQEQPPAITFLRLGQLLDVLRDFRVSFPVEHAKSPNR